MGKQCTVITKNSPAMIIFQVTLIADCDVT